LTYLDEINVFSEIPVPVRLDKLENYVTALTVENYQLLMEPGNIDVNFHHTTVLGVCHKLSITQTPV